MKYILLLSNDPRSVVQIGQWVKDLREEVAIESFTSLKQFTNLLFPEDMSEEEAKQLKSLSSEENKNNVFKSANIRAAGVSLVVLDEDVLKDEKPADWIHALKGKFVKSGLSQENHPTRFFVLGFEAPHKPVEAMAHPDVDDLILKPVDQQLFQQKVVMALSQNQSSTGEFLYQQAIETNIYMAKRGLIEEVSDVAVGIRSKTQVKDGLTARLYCKLFGEGADSTLLGRMHFSMEHPKYPGEFINYYSLYGANKSQILNIRRTLQNIRKPVMNERRFSPKEVEILKKNKKRIAVLAFNKEVTDNIKNALEPNLINSVVHTFTSIIAFARELGLASDSARSAPADSLFSNRTDGKTAFTGDTFSFVVDENGGLQSVDGMPRSEGPIYLDVTHQEILTQPKLWQAFIHPDDVEEISEIIQYLKKVETGQTFLRLRRNDSSEHFVRLDGQKIKTAMKPMIKLTMTELKGKEGADLWIKNRPSQELRTKLDQLQAILIDASAMTSSAAEWSAIVHRFLEKTGIFRLGHKVTIMVLIPEKSPIQLEDFQDSIFDDVILTPLDRKFLIDKICLHVSGLFTETGMAQVVSEKLQVPVQLGQQVKMEMASEFGIQIRSSRAFRDGIFLRFFSPVFLDEKYDGILARSYSAHQDKDDKNIYHNVFSFFGISDAFLKHIRNWIRETHISKKDHKSK